MVEASGVFWFGGWSGVAGRAARQGGAVAIGLTLGLAGCASPGGKPVDAVEIEQTEQQLAQPFQTARKVLADRVTLTMTGNFFAATGSLERALDRSDLEKDRTTFVNSGLVALPATSSQESSTVEVTRDGGSRYVYRPQKVDGFVDQPINLRVGKTDFLATGSVEVIVLGGASRLTLDCLAEGRVYVLEGGEKRQYNAVRFADGRIDSQAWTGPTARPAAHESGNDGR